MQIINGSLFCDSCFSYNCEHTTKYSEFFFNIFSDDTNGNNARDQSIHKKISYNIKKFKPAIDKNTLVVSEYITADMYNVSTFSDGSLVCNCPSFSTATKLQFTGRELSVGGDKQGKLQLYGCKHIVNLINSGVGSELLNAKTYPATNFQRFIASLLCPPENIEKIFTIPLTTTQAYFIVQRLLQHHGLDFKEVIKCLREGKPIPKVPFISVGIEHESGGVDLAKIKSLIQEQGYYGYIASSYYSLEEARKSIRQADDYKISGVIADVLSPNYCNVNVGKDSSISGLPNPFEVKSGRLFGLLGPNSIDGFAKFLKVLRDNGAKSNYSCGLHIHVGVPANKSIRQVADFVHCYQEAFICCLKYLVHPSRYNNSFCALYTQDEIERLKQGCYRDITRYKIINITNYLKKRNQAKNDPSSVYNSTIEYRIFNALSNDFIDENLKSLSLFHLKFIDMSLNKNFLTVDLIKNLYAEAKEIVKATQGEGVSTDVKKRMASALVFRWLLDKMDFNSDFSLWKTMRQTLENRFILYGSFKNILGEVSQEFSLAIMLVLDNNSEIYKNYLDVLQSKGIGIMEGVRARRRSRACMSNASVRM